MTEKSILSETDSMRTDPTSDVHARKLARFFLLALIFGVGAVFFRMTRTFFVPVTLAAAFVSIFYPFYQWVLKKTGNRRGLSALICCTVLCLGGLLPAYGVARFAAKEAVRLYEASDGKEKKSFIYAEKIKKQLLTHRWLQRWQLEKLDWRSTVEHFVKEGGQLLGSFVNRASRETFELISTLFLTFFTMFYFFRDGPMLLQQIRYFSPLSNEYEDKIVEGFVSASRATVKGTLLVSLIKGFLGGLTFWIFGIEAAVLWGVVMVFLSILPLIGAWLIMYPAALFLILNGEVWQGILLFLIALVVIGSIDNLLEPYLVGRAAGMHDLLVFFSIVGGIGLFGIMGFLIGPILAAFFLTLLKIYGIEFSKQLRFVHTNAEM